MARFFGAAVLAIASAPIWLDRCGMCDQLVCTWPWHLPPSASDYASFLDCSSL